MKIIPGKARASRKNSEPIPDSTGMIDRLRKILDKKNIKVR